MKNCYKCKKRKDKSNFYRDKSRKDGLCNLCKECNSKRDRSEYYKQYQKGNTEYYRKRKERIKKRREWINQFRKQCSECGFNVNPVAIDFHHPNQDKDIRVSQLMWQSKERIKKEINKCVPLCANCHRIEHYGHIYEG